MKLPNNKFDLFKLSLVILTTTLFTGCLPKIDKELPPLSEYQESEGWYEDAFIRIYKRDVRAGVHPLEKHFTHPKIVVKRSFSEDIFSFELTEYLTPDPECENFDHINPANRQQTCGYIRSTLGNNSDIDDLAMEWIEDEYRVAYRLGELRGGEDVNQIAEFILFQSENYSCRNEYKILTANSNTYVRSMLEHSGFYQLYQETHEESFTMGSSSFGHESWKNCPIDGIE